MNVPLDDVCQTAFSVCKTAMTAATLPSMLTKHTHKLAAIIASLSFDVQQVLS